MLDTECQLTIDNSNSLPRDISLKIIIVDPNDQGRIINRRRIALHNLLSKMQAPASLTISSALFLHEFRIRLRIKKSHPYRRLRTIWRRRLLGTTITLNSENIQRRS